EEEVRRVENTTPSVERQDPVDAALARRDYVVKLLTRVSEEERMLLMMKEVEGYSVEELAEKTGMNENTIKVKLFRARQKLVRAAQRLERAPGLVAGWVRGWRGQGGRRVAVACGDWSAQAGRAVRRYSPRGGQQIRQGSFWAWYFTTVREETYARGSDGQPRRVPVRHAGAGCQADHRGAPER